MKTSITVKSAEGADKVWKTPPPPEPEVLRIIGKESRRKGTSTLSSRRINQIVKAARTQKSKSG